MGLFQQRLRYETYQRPEIITDPTMPPFGVAEALTPAGIHPAHLFAFWLQTHTNKHYPDGQRFWRTAVLRECLPAADVELNFEALAECLG